MKKIFLSLVFLFAFSLLVLQYHPYSVEASVPVTDEYTIATTTGATYGIPAIKLLKTCSTAGSGTPEKFTACPTVLGSVIVTEAGGAGGHINFYNATTSDINLRTGQAATTTLLKASIPNNLTVGTYTFDILFDTGLLIVFDGSVTVATTTITGR